MQHSRRSQSRVISGWRKGHGGHLGGGLLVFGGGFYSHVFTSRKPSGKYRLILNLKEVNKTVICKIFKMDTIYTTRELLFKGAIIAAIDLKDVYTHQRLLKTFPQICSEMTRPGCLLSIQCPPVWAGVSSQNLYESPGRSLTNAKDHRHPDNTLSG